MSVINQMLNDLQQREQQKQQGQAEPGAALAASVVAAKASPGYRHLVLAVLVTLLCCATAFFIWQLSTENRALKQTLATESPAGKQELSGAGPAAGKQTLAGQVQTEGNVFLAAKEASADKNSSVKETSLTAAAPLADKKTAVAKEALAAEASFGGQPLREPQVTKAEPAKAKPLAEKTALAESKPLASSELTGESAPQPKTEEEAPRLTISRKKISAEELVVQKWAQAEQAINNQQLPQAEALLEDILLLKPEHEQGRKQLAALWFGREAYQAAINVLAQGIAIAPDNLEFRLMQAKIYSARGLNEKAYQVLQGAAGNDNPDYLAARANAAQQTGRYQQASELYRQLTRLQPGLSRWWLGLGVAYDSNSQFDLAVSAYRDALQAGNLSMSSSQFARQRLQQLGG